jgi:hypothetical protein
VDANEAQVWNAAITAVAAVGGVTVGAVVTWQLERGRRQREDRYRFADQKRVAYFDLITVLRRFSEMLTNLAASLEETRNLGTDLKKEKAATASPTSDARLADLASRATAVHARVVLDSAGAKAIIQELGRTIDMVGLLAPDDVRVALQRLPPAAEAMNAVAIRDPGQFAVSSAFQAFKSAEEAVSSACRADLGAG